VTDPTEAPWGPARVLGGIAVLAVLAVLEATAVAIFDPDLKSLAAKLVLQGLLGATLIGVAFIAAAGGRGAVSARALGLRRPRPHAVRAALIAIGAYIVVITALAFVVHPSQKDVAKDLGVNAGTLAAVLAGFLIVVVAPVSEEIFFRGFMFTGFRRRFGWPLAAIVSSLLWAALHLTTSNYAATGQLAALGVILAVLYYRTDSIYPTIGVHVLNNALAFAVLAAK
jgi:membrane protease YdiL (CAAX protease family)